VPTVRPMASVGTRANTRHERVKRTLRQGSNPKAGEAPRGGSLGDTAFAKSVGRPLVVTAAPIADDCDQPPMGSLLSRSAEELVMEQEELDTSTNPEQANYSEADPSRSTPQATAVPVELQAWCCSINAAAAERYTAAAAQPGRRGAPEVRPGSRFAQEH
jgi:hypothetical protein